MTWQLMMTERKISQLQIFASLFKNLNDTPAIDNFGFNQMYIIYVSLTSYTNNIY